MPFEVKVESAALLAQFDDMQKRVAALDTKLPAVFLEWQRHDMKRTFPTIDSASARSSTSAQTGLSVMTRIFPRSRRKRTAATGKGTKRKRQRQRRVISGGTRPILRPALTQKLFDRMIVMCREAIEWR